VWLPREDLVELKEDARRGLVVAEVVLLDAWSPRADVDVTHLPRGGRELEVTVVDVLTCAGLLTVAFVSCRKINNREEIIVIIINLPNRTGPTWWVMARSPYV
jgi:hypothetical protein